MIERASEAAATAKSWLYSNKVVFIVYINYNMCKMLIFFQYIAIANTGKQLQGKVSKCT